MICTTIDELNKIDQMEFNKVLYEALNQKQKRNYKYHKVATVLAEYGYNSMRVNRDWEGADFIAEHMFSGEALHIRLVHRFIISKKNLDKNLYMVFIEDNTVKIYKHDEVIPLLPENTLKSISWDEMGEYHWPKTPQKFDEIITCL